MYEIIQGLKTTNFEWLKKKKKHLSDSNTNYYLTVLEVRHSKWIPQDYH